MQRFFEATHAARLLVLASAFAWAAGPVVAGGVSSPTLVAPNVVPVSPQLVTAGQPKAAALADLRAQGFDAVIYLAPSDVPSAIAQEPAIVREQGLDYVHIPIVFDRPTPGDFEAFRAAMARLAGRKVLVHCQVNMRASVMTFLHRVIVGGELPASAYDAVSKVWSPNRVWRAYIVQTLAARGIAFEPY